jgi:hypothetical protein
MAGAVTPYVLRFAKGNYLPFQRLPPAKMDCSPETRSSSPTSDSDRLKSEI